MTGERRRRRRRRRKWRSLGPWAEEEFGRRLVIGRARRLRLLSGELGSERASEREREREESESERGASSPS